MGVTFCQAVGRGGSSPKLVLLRVGAAGVSRSDVSLEYVFRTEYSQSIVRRVAHFLTTKSVNSPQMLAISCLYPLTGHRLWLSMCKIHGHQREPKKKCVSCGSNARVAKFYLLYARFMCLLPEKNRNGIFQLYASRVRVGRAQPLASTQCMMASTDYSGSNGN